MEFYTVTYRQPQLTVSLKLKITYEYRSQWSFMLNTSLNIKSNVDNFLFTQVLDLWFRQTLSIKLH